jgi:hypothetical protein
MFPIIELYVRHYFFPLWPYDLPRVTTDNQQTNTASFFLHKHLPATSVCEKKTRTNTSHKAETGGPLPLAANQSHNQKTLCQNAHARRVTLASVPKAIKH